MPETMVAQRSERHERATRLFEKGAYEEAALWFSEALLEKASGEVWNDWATAKFFCGHAAEAEGGYRRALELEPHNAQAMTNLGALLAGQRRFSEAVPLLEASLGSGRDQTAAQTAQLLQTCKEGLARGGVDGGTEMRQLGTNFARGLSLQTVSLDRVLFRLMNVENELRGLTKCCEGIAAEVRSKTASAAAATPTPAEPPAATREPIPVRELAKGMICESIEVKPEGQAAKKMNSSFYRGENCNFNPYAADHQSPYFCRDFILKGHLPASKIISRNTRVTAFGSCFAQYITTHLASLSFDVSKTRAPNIHISTIGEGLVNVYSLLQQFTWALEGERPPENLWHGFDAQSFGYDEDVRKVTRDVFLNTDVFILTLGLSEVWFDEVTGGIFWRAVPLQSYDASRHKFRVCSFAETKQALQRMHGLIRKHVPSARIVFTLSPIPLAATFRPISCITASSASKAILRAALDEFLRDLGEEARNRVHYFPAYEIVNELFPQRYIEDCRHPIPMIISSVLNLFVAYYCESGVSAEEAETELRNVRRASAEMAAAGV